MDQRCSLAGESFGRLNINGNGADNDSNADTDSSCSYDCLNRVVNINTAKNHHDVINDMIPDLLNRQINNCNYLLNYMTMAFVIHKKESCATKTRLLISADYDMIFCTEHPYSVSKHRPKNHQWCSEREIIYVCQWCSSTVVWQMVITVVTAHSGMTWWLLFGVPFVLICILFLNYMYEWYSFPTKR